MFWDDVLRDLQLLRERVERIERLLELLIDKLADVGLSDEDLRALKKFLELWLRFAWISS
ncbi:MAG: hypothetical protein NDF54_11885 [archaeon GB-1867-035]|nr:hypothetical protein [Candidatus Culexmicrobium profundum]